MKIGKHKNSPLHVFLLVGVGKRNGGGNFFLNYNGLLEVLQLGSDCSQAMSFRSKKVRKRRM
ncbi:hypothetical protein D3Z55_14670 [Clostridiaceae bacterium]|nr:hypothetical protein [Clostridiaceae bacterium]